MDSWIRLCLTVTILSGTACGPSSPETTDGADGAVVRDSAGVRIVENTAPAWGEGEAWSLSEEPILEIGVMEGPTPYMFSQIRAPRRLPDGSIALLDGASREIRVFDGSGRHVRSMGREGDGPGEFQFPVMLELAGDSLVVWDIVARRASVYSPAGQLERMFELAQHPDELRPADFRGMFNNGDVFASAAPPFDRRVLSGPRWSIRILLRFSPEGGDPIVLGEAETTPCDPARDGECSFLAYGASGSFTLHDDRIYKGRPDRNEISVLDSGGELLSRFRGAGPLQPVTEAMREEFRDAVVAGDPSRAAQRREYVSQASFAEVVPAFHGFLVSADGHIWVREFRIERAPFGYSPAFPPRTSPVRWTVYGPDGILLGEVEIPLDFTVFEIGADYVLGVVPDELGVERVHMYAILKP